MKRLRFYMFALTFTLTGKLVGQTFAWNPVGVGQGMNGSVYCFYNDSTDGNLYVGGNFTRAEIVATNNICRWDGAAYNPIGSGANGVITAMYDDTTTGRLYIAGNFTTFDGQPCNGLVYLQNNTITPISLPAAPNNDILTMTVYNGELIMGGYFTNIGTRLARWDGITCSNFPMNVTNVTYIRSLKVINGNLYAGGDFYTNFGTPDNIAKWNGLQWEDIDLDDPEAIDGPVYDIEYFNNELWICGAFTFTDFNGMHGNIARFDGGNWVPAIEYQDFENFYNGADGPPVDLQVYNGQIYAANGCYFSPATSTSYLWRWTGGTNWSAVSSGCRLSIQYLSVVGGNLYAGGEMVTCGTDSIYMLTRLDTTINDLVTVGGGFVSPTDIQCLAGHGNDLFVGGYIPASAGKQLNKIATWNGTQWDSLGQGLSHSPTCMIRFQGDLVVGGSFNYAGGNPAGRIARWDGNNWFPISSGMNSSVNAIAEYHGMLIAGGQFTLADNNNCMHIAYLDTSGWVEMGSGFDAPVKCLAVYNDTLYAGGQFTLVNGNPVNCLAKWDGTDWIAVGSNDLDGAVNRMYVYNNELYLAGDFVMNFAHVARWNGSNYFGLDNGINNGSVNWFSESNGLLLMGGNFSYVNGSSILSKYITSWDGVQWFSGYANFNSYVNCVEDYQGELYAGGVFTQWNSTNVRYIARKTPLFTDMSLQPVSGRHLTLYPNPAQKNIHVQVPGESKDNLVVIYNSTGEAVRSETYFMTNEFDLELSLTPGFYFIMVTRPEASFIEKIIVN